jgi:hypothetical protein
VAFIVVIIFALHPVLKRSLAMLYSQNLNAHLPREERVQGKNIACFLACWAK